MKKKNKEIQVEECLKDLPAPPENESFKPEEMIDCPACARKNAPTRLKCLYCGAELPATEKSAAQRLSRKLEVWEKGFNIILLPDDKNSGEKSFAEIAKILRLEKGDLQKIFDAGKPLPLARAESETEAEIISKNLREKGFNSAIVSDEKLAVEKNPRRLRGLEFSEGEVILILFNSDEIAKISREDLCLVVCGALFERRIEATQKHLRNKENKILETVELSSDQSLIDLYSQNDAIGYRIEANGFDFSCLGGEKQLLAARNMKNLVEKFRKFAPDATFDENYTRLRAELSLVWEVEQKRDSRGLNRKGFGKFNLESITTINNLRQFTRYSRLQRHLL